ncbi:M1 family aminopeptidase [Rheinheimera sp.]|uniref:M61 family metallopeptidase n=1 Tax=Rheinheimera sp. TaxID=1869214 RepID=UPI0027B8AF36|nr:M1 family aminopeptidase [Rheinheimera sp.]
MFNVNKATLCYTASLLLSCYTGTALASTPVQAATPVQTAAAQTQPAPQIRVKVQPDLLEVDARYQLHGNTLALFNVMGAVNLPAGQAAFIKDLQVEDSQGKSIAVTTTPDGDWVLPVGDQQVRVRYKVQTGHGAYQWPAGVEEIAYKTDEGLFFTGYALFVVPADKMDTNIQVQFELPKGWQAYTPWPKAADNSFQASTRRELLSNAMFFGTAKHQQIKHQDYTLDLVLGAPYAQDSQRFTSLLQSMLQQSSSMFGSTPNRKQYLIVVNEGFADGGAFEGSFSQLIKGPATDANRVVWGNVMAHELLHFWNGLSMVPATVDDEWFKEGFTDYLTAVLLHRGGQFDQAWMLKRFETMYSRHAIGRYYQRSQASFQQAGHDKQPLRTLVYGGGALVAMAMEAEMRDATQGKKGVADLMRSMFSEFGTTAPGQLPKGYSSADIIRHVKLVSGVDMTDFFRRYVSGNEYLDITPYLARMGLTVSHFIEEADIRLDANASKAAKRNFQQAYAAQ